MCTDDILQNKIQPLFNARSNTVSDFLCVLMNASSQFWFTPRIIILGDILKSPMTKRSSHFFQAHEVSCGVEPDIL